MFDMENIQDLAEQAAKAQKEMQDKLAKMAIEGSAGGDSVIVTVNGRKELTRIRLSESACKNPTLLEDWILAAMNDAYTRAQQEVDNQIPTGFNSIVNNIDISKVMDMFKK